MISNPTADQPEKKKKKKKKRQKKKKKKEEKVKRFAKSLFESCLCELLTVDIDCHDFSRKHSQIHNVLNSSSAVNDDFERLHTSDDEVRRAFQHVNTNKASGPDNIAPRILRTCAEQLAHIFALYSVCVSPQILYKLLGRPHALCMYQKSLVASSLNDLRRVAPTSAVTKVCERVVVCKLDS